MRTYTLALGIGTMSIVAYCQQQLATPTAPQQKSTVEEIPKVTAEKTMSFWMAKKLEHSKMILESLTKGDSKQDV